MTQENRDEKGKLKERSARVGGRAVKISEMGSQSFGFGRT